MESVGPARIDALDTAAAAGRFKGGQHELRAAVAAGKLRAYGPPGSEHYYSDQLATATGAAL